LTKILVSYAYYETDDARRNLSFFCRHGITPDRNRQFIVVINGGCTIEDQIPRFENVVVLKRENKGFDFGGWAHALRQVQLDQFDYFFFINSSVTGPFLPGYQDTHRWPELFTSKLNDRVKLVGTTINAYGGNPHVQSMFLAMDRVGLDLLIRNGIFTDNDKDGTKLDTVFRREIRSSNIITDNGFCIDSMDLIYSGRSLPFLKRETVSDIFYPRGYIQDYTLEPLDICFFKTNRGCSAEVLERSMKLTDYKRSVAANRCLQDERILRTIAALKCVPSAWKAYIEFAVWLTCRFLPQKIVDLGVDYGCSTYAWGSSGVSQVIGIDWFKGDEQTGFRDTSGAISSLGHALVRDCQYRDTVRIWRTSFEDAAKVYNEQIDVLHIDGLHTYEAITKDLKDWLPKLTKDGVIVMHGISVLPDTVGRAFEKLRQPKIRLEHSTGLGVACANPQKIDIIEKEWKQDLGR
jgi:hypothetical protein